MSQIQNQDERDVLTLARWLRGRIRCNLSTERKCGYIIRPELYFTTFRAGTSRALESKGIEIRIVYSNVEEITRILHMIEGLEEWSDTMDGILEVKKWNGVLVQPKTHKEVVSALELIKDSREIKSDTGFPSLPNAEEIP